MKYRIFFSLILAILFFQLPSEMLCQSLDVLFKSEMLLSKDAMQIGNMEESILHLNKAKSYVTNKTELAWLRSAFETHLNADHYEEAEAFLHQYVEKDKNYLVTNPEILDLMTLLEKKKVMAIKNNDSLRLQNKILKAGLSGNTDSIRLFINNYPNHPKVQELKTSFAQSFIGNNNFFKIWDWKYTPPAYKYESNVYPYEGKENTLIIDIRNATEKGRIYFSKFPNLRTLYLIKSVAYNDLSLESQTLSNIYIDSCNLESIPQINCPNLSYLNVKNNAIEKVSNIHVRSKSRLATVILNNNKISDWPVLLNDCPQLKVLNIHDNNIKKINLAKNTLSRLEYLNLENNPIAQLDTSIYRCPNLKGLFIAGTNILSIPPGIHRLDSLKEITVNSSMTQVPEELFAMKGIEAIGVKFQKYGPATLPPWIYKMNRLTELDIHNELALSVDIMYAKFRRLESLVIDDWNMRSLAPEIHNCLSLKKINIVNSPFLKIDSTLLGLESIESLDLNDTPYADEDLLKLRLNLPGLTITYFDPLLKKQFTSAPFTTDFSKLKEYYQYHQEGDLESQYILANLFKDRGELGLALYLFNQITGNYNIQGRDQYLNSLYLTGEIYAKMEDPESGISEMGSGDIYNRMNAIFESHTYETFAELCNCAYKSDIGLAQVKNGCIRNMNIIKLVEDRLNILLDEWKDEYENYKSSSLSSMENAKSWNEIGGGIDEMTNSQQGVGGAVGNLFSTFSTWSANSASNKAESAAFTIRDLYKTIELNKLKWEYFNEVLQTHNIKGDNSGKVQSERENRYENLRLAVVQKYSQY